MAEDDIILAYSLMITPDETGGYGVAVPDLLGCFTFASIWDEIRPYAREAMESWIESALKHGDPVPEPALLAVS